MADRDQARLACPDCGRAERVVWLVGTGPNTAPGEGPAYVRLMEAGGWLAETKATVPRWAGRITCPDCGATVLKRPSGEE